MKVLCLIMSLYVFYLSTAPCCWDYNCNDEIKTEYTDSHSQDRNDSDCNTCSPFLTCGTCTGFVFSKLRFVFKEVYYDIDKFIIVYKSQFTDDFFAKIWQPPKIS